MTTKEDIDKYYCPICGQQVARIGHESGYPYFLSGCTHYRWVECHDSTWTKYPAWCEEMAKKAILYTQDVKTWYYLVPR